MRTVLGSFALTAIASVVLGGCASGYKEFYQPVAGVTQDEISTRRASPPLGPPIVERASPSDLGDVLAAYERRGLVIVGSSMFNSGRREPEASAVEQGESIGADLVLLLDPQYTGTVTSNIPITTPTTSTSHSTGSATIYGAGGPVTARGSATTTTYGTETTYVPVVVHRSDYGALYFVRFRFALGVFTRDLDDEERRTLQTNQGAVVRNVVDNSPAFSADVLVGDVITEIDGTRVANADAIGGMTGGRRGRSVNVKLVRDGEAIEKTIQLDD